MQEIIEAKNSDLFDVLAYVAFAMQPVTREQEPSPPRIKSTPTSREARSLSRFRTIAVRERRRGRTGSGKTLAPTQAQIQKRIADAMAI